MRREVVELVGGGSIETLVPESEEDLRTLEAMEEEVDDRLSFGDDPKVAAAPARRRPATSAPRRG